MSKFDYSTLDELNPILYTLSAEMSPIKDEHQEGVHKALNKAIQEGRVLYDINMYVWAIINEISEWGKGVTIDEILEYSNNIYTKSEIFRALSNLETWYLIERGFKEYKKDMVGSCWWVAESTWDIGCFHPQSKAMRVATVDGKSELRSALEPISQKWLDSSKQNILKDGGQKDE